MCVRCVTVGLGAFSFSDASLKHRMTMKLSFPRLHVDTSVTKVLIDWYCQRLGMNVLKTMQNDTERIHWVGYENMPSSSFVEFRSDIHQANPPKSYLHKPSSDVYWKIGLSLIDVDTARSKLVRQGVDVTSPKQFRDIGYMCHLKDPYGYSIELLQHDFQSNFRSERIQSSLQPNLALGQQTHLGQITLRVSNIEKSLRFYQSALGMKLLSRQNIPDMFDLYFLACTDEKPPSDDLNAVEIREWLWRRPYTTLELQYWPQEDRKYTTADLDRESGFSALAFTVDAQRFEELKITLDVRDVSQKYPEYGNRVLQCKDPDEASVLFIQE